MDYLSKILITLTVLSFVAGQDESMATCPANDWACHMVQENRRLQRDMFNSQLQHYKDVIQKANETIASLVTQVNSVASIMKEKDDAIEGLSSQLQTAMRNYAAEANTSMSLRDTISNRTNELVKVNGQLVSTSETLGLCTNDRNVCRGNLNDRTGQLGQCQQEVASKDAQIPKVMQSCVHWKLAGYSNSGFYMVDPESDGVDAFNVYCHMDYAVGQVLTEVNHSAFGTTSINGPQPCSGGFNRIQGDCGRISLRYAVNAPIQSMRHLVGSSANCTMMLDWKCHRMSLMTFLSQGDEVIRYFHRDNPSNTDSNEYCNCGLSGTCTDPAKKCNCYRNEPLNLQDTILLHGNIIPLETAVLGDLNENNETVSLNFGTLKCPMNIPSL